MKKQQLAGAFCAGVFSLGLMGTADAALIGRLAATPGGTDYQAYYDDTLDITWLADANYAQTSGYDADGLMTWDASMTWVGTLNTATHLGYNDWRLPGVDTSCSGFSCTGSEMGSLFYDTLGVTAGSSIFTGNAAELAKFTNVQSNLYWSGVEYAPNTFNAWLFYTGLGYQDFTLRFNTLYGWAVRSGDVSAVPVPAAVWLFGSGLIGLLGLAKRNRP